MRAPHRLGLIVTLTAAVTAVAIPATAQERSLNFALLGGIEAVPDYPGSKAHSVVPDLGFTFGALKWGRTEFGDGIGAPPDNGFALRGAFKVQGSRKAADHPELAGLTDIDTTIELGLGVSYQRPTWLAFGEVRKGFGGHDGMIGTFGADLITRPSERWTLSVGPRVQVGNSAYASTFFGVTSAESLASGFSPFVADGGVLGAGITIDTIYSVDGNWALETRVSYEKLMNDAADSPIVAAGSDDQWTIGVGLSRAFTVNF